LYVRNVILDHHSVGTLAHQLNILDLVLVQIHLVHRLAATQVLLLDQHFQRGRFSLRPLEALHVVSLGLLGLRDELSIGVLGHLLVLGIGLVLGRLLLRVRLDVFLAGHLLSVDLVVQRLLDPLVHGFDTAKFASADVETPVHDLVLEVCEHFGVDDLAVVQDFLQLQLAHRRSHAGLCEDADGVETVLHVLDGMFGVGHFDADIAVGDDLNLVLGLGLELHEVDVERLHVDHLFDLVAAGDQAGHALV